jgi:hypothetical protein
MGLKREEIAEQLGVVRSTFRQDMAYPDETVLRPAQGGIRQRGFYLYL